MGLDIEKICSNKSKDYLIAFQKVILDTMFDFMSIDQENYDYKVDLLLKKIGIFFEVDRTYLFTIQENGTMIYSHEWCGINVNPLIDREREIPLDIYPWWFEQLSKNKIVCVEDVNRLPAEATLEQEDLRIQGVKSIVSIPISVEGNTQAYIGIDTVKSTKKWTEENIEVLQIMARILSRGITQINHVNKIHFLAYHDPLTGLPNRTLLTKKLKQGILQASSQGTSISILFLNLDGFKRINDTLGYHHGDELLKQVSKRLLNSVSKNETVFRTDGDQFVLCIMDYQDESNLDYIVSNIIDIFNQPFILKGEEYVITASAGLSLYPIDGENVDSLLESAYTAMHQAKSLGKNQYLKHTEELRKKTRETLSLTNDLYYAIERNEMTLHYQPQVNGVTGEILGVEALLRWKHPEFGFVSPFKFIPLAEKTRLILPIGQWVLETACKQLSKWQEKGFKPIKLAVNFSAHQLNHPNIIKEIEEILDKTSIQPEYLEVEITESVAIDNNPAVKNTLRKIKEQGITLSIDDYGKEYSSLKRLTEESVDAMKIDMSFIQGIGSNTKDEIVIKSLLSLASELGLKTVAEGVETKEQVDFLNEMSCDILQGYYFHRPMPAAEIDKLLAQN